MVMPLRSLLHFLVFGYDVSSTPKNVVSIKMLTTSFAMKLLDYSALMLECIGNQYQLEQALSLSSQYAQAAPSRFGTPLGTSRSD